MISFSLAATSAGTSLTAAEILCQKGFHCRHHCKIVDGPGIAVALVGGDEIFDRLSIVAHGGDNLIALPNIDARIVLALDNHQRSDDGICPRKRRLGNQESFAFLGLGIGDPRVHRFLAGFPIYRQQVELRDKVGRSHNVHGHGVNATPASVA